MRISVIGMGYVGCVTAACIANNINHVIGVDLNKDRIECIKKGKAPFYEKSLDDILSKVISNGYLEASTDLEDSVLKSDLSFISVGTPDNGNGNLDMSFVYDVCKDIGYAIKKKESFHIIIIRSTVAPGTAKYVEEIISSVSGKQADKDFTVALNPEFLREGCAIYDFMHPGLVVLGTNNKSVVEIVKNIYSEVLNSDENEFVVSTPEVVELLKTVNNSFHALKICFANEIGNICKSLHVDGKELMSIFCMDKKLNISDYYLKPGFAYGGSCLPKDLAELNYIAKQTGTDIPLINTIEISNQKHLESIKNSIIKDSKKHIGILGLAFKSDTDDFRNSPVCKIIEELVSEKYGVSVYDEYIDKQKLPEYICERFEDDVDSLIQKSDVVVIVNKSSKFGLFRGNGGLQTTTTPVFI